MQPLAEIWEEHKTHLRGYVAKRVRERDAVDNILQDVFVKAHDNLHALKFRGSVASWLFRIASNAITDHYRAQKLWVELPAELIAPEPEHDPVRELAGCLKPLIAALPESYRSALILSEIEGLPQSEVAKRLGISHSGAKSRVQRGREKLRQRLLDCCVIETGRRGIVGFEPKGKGCEGPCA